MGIGFLHCNKKAVQKWNLQLGLPSTYSWCSPWPWFCLKKVYGESVCHQLRSRDQFNSRYSEICWKFIRWGLLFQQKLMSWSNLFWAHCIHARHHSKSSIIFSQGRPWICCHLSLTECKGLWHQQCSHKVCRTCRNVCRFSASLSKNHTKLCQHHWRKYRYSSPQNLVWSEWAIKVGFERKLLLWKHKQKVLSSLL